MLYMIHTKLILHLGTGTRGSSSGAARVSFAADAMLAAVFRVALKAFGERARFLTLPGPGFRQVHLDADFLRQVCGQTNKQTMHACLCVGVGAGVRVGVIVGVGVSVGAVVGAVVCWCFLSSYLDQSVSDNRLRVLRGFLVCFIEDGAGGRGGG